MVPDYPIWIRVLIRLAARHAPESEIGDVVEEYSAGQRTRFWLARQLLSIVRLRSAAGPLEKGRREMLSTIWRDVRYALRMLARNPGFAVAAIAPIALGIGINTGLFSILNSIALRPLPTPDSHQLVTVHQQFQGVKTRRVHGARSLFSAPEYETYRDGSKTLSGVMAYAVSRAVTLGGHAPQDIPAVVVTCNYFEVLQIRPVLGSGFTAANCERADAPPAAVITHGLWTRVFSGDTDILSKTIALNGQHLAIAGVAPEGFDGVDLTSAAVFVPVPAQRVIFPQQQNFAFDADTSWLTIVGRRRDEMSLAQVRAELALIAADIDRRQPPRQTTLIIEPSVALSLPPARRDIMPVAGVVLIAFGLVLLIACANVANLMLARAAGRAREIAVRVSVGASRARLLQQLLTESLIIALSGGLAGSLLAWWSFQALLAWLLSSLPDGIPHLRIDANPDATVLTFGLALTAITALAFGLIPALKASRPDLHNAMKLEGSAATSRTGWMRGVLIGAQVAVCMVLLISAALLLRALHVAQTLDPGFDYADVATVELELRDPSYTDTKLQMFRQQMLERVGALPGVRDVALVSKLPMTPGHHQTSFRVPGQNQDHEFDFNTVSGSYFSALRIPIVRGRSFSAVDHQGIQRTAIIPEATARRYFPGQDPLGHSLLMWAGPGNQVALEIVGVAADVRIAPDAEVTTSYVYVPASDRGERRLRLVVRTVEDRRGIAAEVRTIVRELDPTLVVRVGKLEDTLEFWRARSRLVAGLAGSLSLLALVLSCLGVYGVVSWLVARRRREVGIRMTLGANARSVQGLVLRQTLRPVMAGALLGMAGAAAASRALESVLFGVSPWDPVAFLGAPLVLIGVAAAATLLPTRAALRVDPVAALRHD